MHSIDLKKWDYANENPGAAHPPSPKIQMEYLKPLRNYKPVQLLELFSGLYSYNRSTEIKSPKILSMVLHGQEQAVLIKMIIQDRCWASSD